jgi:AcrR family transcriptional regulator
MVDMAGRMAAVNTHVYGQPMTDRLAKSDWISHGLSTLAREGVHALKVGPMADGLNVSRGSFYWHFRDIGDFRAQLLQSWQEEATDRVIRDLEAEKDRPDRLKQLMRRAFASRRSLDRAIRSWAAGDREVAAIVASVDARRVAYIAKMLTAAGVEGQKAQRRAAFLYWAFLGQRMVMDPRHASIAPTALDDITDLFEK